MNLAKERGIFISFDPNFRKDLWEGREQEFIELTKVAVSKADFIKVSKEELNLITGKEDLGEAVEYLHQLGGKIVAVTLGKEGTFLSSSSGQQIVPSIPIKSIDSTGAGDGFVGATLFQLSEEEDPFNIIKNFKRQEEIIRFSNKAGAIVCTKIGAITALPTLEEVISEKK